MGKKKEIKIDESKFLYGKIKTAVEIGLVKLEEIPSYILNNLSPRFEMREYQEETFRYLITYLEEPRLQKYNQHHLLFHMATGSGKTYIMAGAILNFYKAGYRNFIFFVNDTTIIEKTKENFVNKQHLKYLFNEKIIIDGNNVEIRVIDNFEESNDTSINIKFTTIQQLHRDITNPKENNITINHFKEEKVVLIADEAHHINTYTKKKLTKDEDENKKSWEESIMDIMNISEDNVLLEFTATCDLKHELILEKYIDKIIYNYPLLKFKESGYTKELYTIQSNYDPMDRTIQAMLLSQYRLKLFERYSNLIESKIKPTILLKSDSIDNSKKFYDSFINYIENDLSTSCIRKFRNSDNDNIKAMFKFFDEENITEEILVQELRNDFSEKHLIIMNSKEKNLDEKQKLVNDLENPKNPYRMIFTVDMLTEGWDVLNLFDIVRLYETKQNTKKSSTMSDAQLIGRGARYCPFKLDEQDNPYKRKFDSQLDNKLRICETLYYHSKQDLKYLEELKKKLVETGFNAEKIYKFEYRVKPEFQETKIFQEGKLFVNRCKKKAKDSIKGLPTNLYIQAKLDVSENTATELDLTTYKDENLNRKTSDEKYKVVKKVKEIDKRIVLKSLRNYSVMKFDNLKSKFPNLKSTDEFIKSDDYIGKFELTLTKNEDNITNIDYYNGLNRLFEKLAEAISNIKDQYEGLKEFTAEPLSYYVKNAPREKSTIGHDGEGVSQNDSKVKKEYRLDLSDKDWFVYDDNYGTTEEKKFVAYFATQVDELRKIYSEIYLIRNERKLHIYSFKDGGRFEPDYILLLKRKDNSAFEQQQIFIEPKGGHLLEKDNWKEEFLLELEEKAQVELYSNEEYKIIGLPFYNEDSRDMGSKFDNFDKSFKNLMATNE